MSIKTKSVFYYGHIVTDQNFAVDFKEGATTYQADFPIGDYSLSEFVTQLASTLSNNGGQEYTVTVDRTTRLITIIAPTDFELLVDSGRAASLYSLIGFTGADRTGNNSYTGNTASGSEWAPQNIPENYTPKEDNVEDISPSINETTNGIIESLSFGERSFYEMNFRYITDIPQSNASPFDTDANGRQNARNFLLYAKTKAKFEFMPDRSDRDTYDIVLLEKIQGYSSGTGFKIKKMFGEAGPAYFETGLMTLRVNT